MNSGVSSANGFLNQLRWRGHLGRWEDVCLASQLPHRKNDGTLLGGPIKSLLNAMIENNDKVMFFVEIVKDKIVIVHACIDDDGRRIFVDGSCYLALRLCKVWPTSWASATRWRLWWMQDGGSTTLDKRGNFTLWITLIFTYGRRSKRLYSLKNLNPFKMRPFTANYDAGTIRRVTKNVMKRARFFFANKLMEPIFSIAYKYPFEIISLGFFKY